MKKVNKKFQKEYENSNHGWKFLWLSDLHIPFHRIELIEQAIDDHSDADVCVIGGDFFDEYGVSSFHKDEFIPLLKEYEIGCKIMEVLCKKFKWVIAISGNHDVRVYRQIMSKLPMETKGVMGECLLQRMARGDRYDFEEEEWHNTGVMENLVVPVESNGNTDWKYQVGKTIFCHAEKYSKIHTKAVQEVDKWFNMNDYEYDCIVMGHTHKLGQVWTKKSLLIEAGCLRHPADYAQHPKCRYSPQTNGYAVIYQDKYGNTDHGKSRAVFLGY